MDGATLRRPRETADPDPAHPLGGAAGSARHGLVGLTGASLAGDTAAKRRRKGQVREKAKEGQWRGEEEGQARPPRREAAAPRPARPRCGSGRAHPLPSAGHARGQTCRAGAGVRAHLGHGDTLGACGSTNTTRPPVGCQASGSLCLQDSDCCIGNCFNFVCADRVPVCSQGGATRQCVPPANGCAGGTCCYGSAACGDRCCQPPANQCNPQGEWLCPELCESGVRAGWLWPGRDVWLWGGWDVYAGWRLSPRSESAPVPRDGTATR